MTVPHRWIVNLSLLFTELPLVERPAAAAAEGFDGVEVWWPFGTTGTPDDAEVERFIDAVRDAGVELYAMNLFAGDMPAGERGVLSYPERVDEFRQSVAIAARIAGELGTAWFNAPYGHRRDGLDHAEQDELAAENLAFAAAALGKHGGTVLLEPLAKMPRYPLTTAQSAFDVIDRIRDRHGVENIGYLLDQYHAMTNGEDVVALAAHHGPRIAHIQIADVPNRGEPGSGESADEIRRMIAALDEHGYAGVLALEYFPTIPTDRSLQTWRAAFPDDSVGASAVSAAAATDPAPGSPRP